MSIYMPLTTKHCDTSKGDKLNFSLHNRARERWYKMQIMLYKDLAFPLIFPSVSRYTITILLFCYFLVLHYCRVSLSQEIKFISMRFIRNDGLDSKILHVILTFIKWTKALTLKFKRTLKEMKIVTFQICCVYFQHWRWTQLKVATTGGAAQNPSSLVENTL